ncbi:SVSP family protein [Theileria parva strain Muguga]|uniref:Theileria-specific sub-telomeric protein, SVSP family n=1 Tax=Theileria parva TaxID=5875 RepID=Q4N9U7_THEPA|nr:SVSP family protein [Theileria parva strain Muguga]EAN33253.1 SVSP family protein [Theileria parva strain Muguga]|eukprot:XP_765536.1 hypothetical protein [Theileria parva strain Muguga]
MNKSVIYTYTLVFFIVKFTDCSDKPTDQSTNRGVGLVPHTDSDEEEYNNFDVSNLTEIEHQTGVQISPQYTTHYQPIPEPQYHQQLQPQTQQYGQYQPHVPLPQVTQPQTQEQQYPITYQHYWSPVPQVTQETQPIDYYITPIFQPSPTQYEQLTYYHVPPTTQPQPIQPSYQYYVPTQTQVTQESQTQQTYQQHYGFYQPLQLNETQTEVRLSEDIEETFEEKLVTQEMDHLLGKLKQKIGHPDKTQVSKQQPIQPGKRTQTSGDEDGDEEEEEDEEEPIKRHPLIRIIKSKTIKLFKKDSSGNLVEMNNDDYVVKHNDSHKRKYKLIADLEQIRCEDEIIYVHSSGAPYCTLLTHSRRTNIIIITNSNGFTLIKKTKGRWKRTDYLIPDFVNLYTQDSGGNEVIINNKDYTIDFTSKASFRYILLPGVKCYKIEVKDIIVWKKTVDLDRGFPKMIYVSPKLRVIINCEGYSKMFIRRVNRYQLVYSKKTIGVAKYT